MVTIKDVAKLARVSISTVSRVINNSDHPVNLETRNRILEAVEELGFYPNAMARSLQRKHTQTIGLIIPDISNPYYPRVVRGVEDVAQKKGYTLILCNTDRSRERTQEYLRVLREKRVDGIIFTGGGAVEEAAQENFFDQQNIATVLIGRHKTNLPSVRVDNVQVARKACDYLVKQGYHQIIMIAGPESSITARDRLRGYRQSLTANGITLKKEWIIRGDFEFESGYEAIAKLPPFDAQEGMAILAQNDLMAIGAIKALQEKGIKIPEEVAVIGFDNIPLASYISPKLSTVAVPAYELGATAMRVLVELLEGKKVPQVTIMDAELIIRQSML